MHISLFYATCKCLTCMHTQLYTRLILTFWYCTGSASVATVVEFTATTQFLRTRIRSMHGQRQPQRTPLEKWNSSKWTRADLYPNRMASELSFLHLLDSHEELSNTLLIIIIIITLIFIIVVIIIAC